MQQALHAARYPAPTPIQRQAIPSLLDGRDLLGCAQTGTGKTAAFALPILQRLAASAMNSGPRAPRALVLTPTRELAGQVRDSFRAYGRNLKLVTTAVFGGVNQDRQVRDLERGVDILVATPGRLLDLLGQRKLRLDRVEVLVLDEADRMLDMGFINDIRRVVSLVPKQRQTLLFSATMPAEIAKLADSLLTNPAKVAVTPPATTVARIEESVVFVEESGKRDALRDLLIQPEVSRTLVFARTKHGANKVVKHLCEDGIQAEALHGNKSQAARERALANFKAGATRVLVATDLAARGIDVAAISHVVNYNLPDDPESYVHRIGRTARAGAGGVAVTFCASAERATLRVVEKLIGHRVPSADGNDPRPVDTPMVTRRPIDGRERQRQEVAGGRPGVSDGHGRRGQPPAQTASPSRRPRRHFRRLAARV